MKECWNLIGVGGDGTCMDLAEHIHCRNCPVYSSAARTVLNGPLPDGYLDWWTVYFAERQSKAGASQKTLLVFRVGREWLGLPTPAVWEITDPRPVHSLPHRPAGVVRGLVNVRGELLICVSLEHLLGVEPADTPSPTTPRRALKRLLVIRRDGVRVACVADEVEGIHGFKPGALKVVPSTVARASAHSKGVISMHDRAIGVLDEPLLFASIQRSLA